MQKIALLPREIGDFGRMVKIHPTLATFENGGACIRQSFSDIIFLIVLGGAFHDLFVLPG